MTDKQDALDALDYIQYDWQQKDGQVSFQEQCDVIRQTLTTPAVDVEALVSELENNTPIWGGLNSDQRRQFKRCLSHLAARGLIGKAQKSDTVAVPRDVLHQVMDGLEMSKQVVGRLPVIYEGTKRQMKRNEQENQAYVACTKALSLLQPYTKGEK